MPENQKCPRCGTPKGQWRMQGAKGARGTDGQLFCSSACADSARSKINQAIQEVYLEDDVKGPAEEPSTMEHIAKDPIEDPGQVGHGSGPAGGEPAPRVKEDDPETV